MKLLPGVELRAKVKEYLLQRLAGPLPGALEIQAKAWLEELRRASAERAKNQEKRANQK